MGILKDITGQKFGRLTVIKYIGADKDRHSLWECACDCGNTYVAKANSIRRGLTKSCGCLQKESVIKMGTKHNLCHTRLYKIRASMKTRCYNPNAMYFSRYGGRGIKICNEWLGKSGFINFYDWAMSHGYSENLTIDRTDNDGDYEPGNCQWSTKKEQANNNSQNHKVSYHDSEYTISQLSELLGIDPKLMQYRVSRVWPEDKLSLTPRDCGRKKLTQIINYEEI